MDMQHYYSGINASNSSGILAKTHELVDEIKKLNYSIVELHEDLDLYNKSQSKYNNLIKWLTWAMLLLAGAQIIVAVFF
jgi:hypothetical protein